MLIRLARFDRASSDDRDWVIEALASVPGVHAAYHALDRDTRAMFSISVYDDQKAADAGFAGIAASAAARGHQGVPPDETRFCEVVRSFECATEPVHGEDMPA
jgi:hypothetical protein